MGMHTFYPSKWFAVIAFPLLGVALIGGLFFLYQRDLQSQDTPSGIAIENADQGLRQYVLENDQDKDSLPDWAENLWHTDPHKPDTDGDGTKDGDEVTRNRNPAVPGPNDVLEHIDTTAQTRSGTSTVSSATSTRTTTVVARELFGSYLMLKQAGKFDQAAQQKLVGALSASITKQVNLKPYTLADIKIVGTSTKDINDYDKTVGVIFGKFLAIAKTKQNELVLLKQILETKNYAELTKISDNALIYADVSKQLRLTPVPKDIASQHLTLVNDFQAYADMADVLSKFRDDPVRGLVYIKDSQEIEVSIRQAISNILAYIKAHRTTT